MRKSVSLSGTFTILACAGLLVAAAALALQVAGNRPGPAPAAVPVRVATSSPTATVAAATATATSKPTATAVPSAAPTNAPTPESVPWNEALLTHLTTTVCSAAAWAPDPLPAWCGSFASVVLSGDILIVRSTLTPADVEQVTLMGQGLSSFVYNNEYRQYGIRAILIFADADGATLYERNGL